MDRHPSFRATMPPPTGRRPADRCAGDQERHLAEGAGRRASYPRLRRRGGETARTPASAAVAILGPGPAARRADEHVRLAALRARVRDAALRALGRALRALRMPALRAKRTVS